MQILKRINKSNLGFKNLALLSVLSASFSVEAADFIATIEKPKDSKERMVVNLGNAELSARTCHGVQNARLAILGYGPINTDMFLPHNKGCWTIDSDGMVNIKFYELDYSGDPIPMSVHSDSFKKLPAFKPEYFKSKDSIAREAAKLIENIGTFDKICVSGSENDAQVVDACNKRDKALVEMNKFNLCWGPKGNLGKVKDWYQCK